MGSQIGLSEYTSILENKENEKIFETEAIFKSASFLFDNYLKIRVFIRMTPTDPDSWIQNFNDDDLDIEKISGN